MDERCEPAKAFGEYLVGKSVINAAGLSRTLAALTSTNHPLDTVLIELGLVREDRLYEHFAGFLDIPALAELDVEPDLEVLDRVGIDFLLSAAVLPISTKEEKIGLVVADPVLSDAPDMLRFMLDRPVSLLCASRSRIVETLQIWNQETHGKADAPASEGEQSDLGLEDIDRLKDVANEAPIIRLVADIAQRAVERRATDIHIEPFEEMVQIRMRSDGTLSLVESVPKRLHAGLSTRLKILSRLNIAERRMPQDGRMRMSVRGQEIDMRVSALPSVHGETFVLRILDSSAVPLRLDALGYGDRDVEILKGLSQLNNGILLITGPTGSGKTTTLYSMIREIETARVKVFTVEDPIEYRMEGITQIQVNSAIDLDFARILRTVLRQDPDVILIGEIRDAETARIAIRAALTGHLVLSTLHTNSAIGAFSRLVDMGVESYLLADTVRAVIGQRLLRKRCKTCNDDDAGDCPNCGSTGYAGRIATYEILKVTPQIASLIHDEADDANVEKAASAGGFRSLRNHARGLVDKGITDLREIQRVLNSEES
jgi:general secretion pathway protein E